MARASKFIKTKSNYVLKDKHQVLSNGTVFERDFMTISGSDGMSPTEEQYYRSSNFKFVVRNGINRQKKHTNGKWVSDNGISLSNAVTTSDLKIILNPNYESMLDFAYYGSAVDMVKAAIIDIALRFPAELYFSDNTIEIEGVENIDDGTWYVVDNDYGLDIYTEDKGQDFDNELRYLDRSFDRYEPYSPRTVLDECSCTIDITAFTPSCVEIDGPGAIIAITDIGLQDEVVTVYVYKIKDSVFYLYNNTNVKRWSIRPKQSIVDEFYESLDDFERVLLDRDSKPKYTATFDTPYETDKGYFKYKRKYTWPSEHGWNPDLSGLGYETYIEELIRLASFHDEYNTNNIWRSMTHEAIKNLDWTFTKEQGDNIQEMDVIDTSKVEPILKIYGRQYDDIKRKIDNIAKSLTVTFDKKDNVPDYFIDDVLNISGWETKSVSPVSGDTMSPVLYDGMTQGYSAVEANNEFLRRLKICSPYLLSAKGTQKGLDMLLGLFGMKRGDDYCINEYIAIASGDPMSYSSVTEVNKTKYNYMASENDPLQGLPLAKIVVGEEEYVIPWFDKNKKYDGDTYFQMKGGWGKHIENGVELVRCGGNAYNGVAYDETMSDIRIVRTLDELIDLGRYVVKTGDICYVYDISGIEEHFPEENANRFSHYFFLSNDEYVGTIGAVEGAVGLKGWMPVYNEKVRFSGDTAYTGTLREVYEERGYVIEEVGADTYDMYVPVNDITILRGKDNFKANFQLYDICCDLDDSQFYYLVSGTTENEWGEFSGDTEHSCDNLIKIHRVNYLESIKDDTTGNNPHGGHGLYDDGFSYIERMLYPFKPAIDTNKIITTDAQELAETLNFDETDGDRESWLHVDNKKCWWFKNVINEDADNDTEKFTTLVSFTATDSDKTDTSDGEYEIDQETHRPNFNNFIDTLDSGVQEAATDSIINVKNLLIEFKYPHIYWVVYNHPTQEQIDECIGVYSSIDDLEHDIEAGIVTLQPGDKYLINNSVWKWSDTIMYEDEFENYVKDKVLFYLRQMIPATTIFNYKFVSDFETCVTE